MVGPVTKAKPTSATIAKEAAGIAAKLNIVNGEVKNAGAVGEEAFKFLQKYPKNAKEASDTLAKELIKGMQEGGVKSISGAMQSLMATPVFKNLNLMREAVLAQLLDDFKDIEGKWKEGKYGVFPNSMSKSEIQNEAKKFAKDVELLSEAEKKAYTNRVNGVFVEAGELLKQGKTMPDVLKYISVKIAEIRSEMKGLLLERTLKTLEGFAKKSKLLETAFKASLEGVGAHKLPEPSFGELPKFVEELSKYKVPKKAAPPVMPTALATKEAMSYSPKHWGEQRVIIKGTEAKALQAQVAEAKNLKELEKLGKAGLLVAGMLALAALGYIAYEATKE